MLRGTITEGARENARRMPERVVFTWLADGERQARALTASELDRDATRVAAELRRRGPRQQRVVVACEPGPGFIVALLGCFYAAAVAVPTAPPRRRADLERCLSIARHSGARLVLASAGIKGVPDGAGLGPEWLAIESLLDASDGTEARDALDAPARDELALIQYTSGSTGQPRGVLVTHANLAHNSAAIGALRGSDPVVGANWLPPYHDMGLVGAIVHPLHAADVHSVLMSPHHFLQRPARWLEAVTRYRAAVSAAPDFALRWCAERISDRDRAGLDLASWRLLISGAEPVRHATWQKFSERFAGVGLDPDVIAPCYGLAESTLLVSGRRLGEAPRFERLAAGSLEDAGETPRADEPQKLVACCGQPLPGQSVVIADAELRPVPPGIVGEIFIAGPSVAAGYFDDEDASRRTFGVRLADGSGPFLRSGDLGLLGPGGLSVVGRIKDVLKLRGRSINAQDIESAAGEAHPALHVGGVAAVSIDDGEREELLLLAELEPSRRRTPPDEIFAALRDAVVRSHALAPAAIGLLVAWALPRTSSGKLRRHECRRRFLEGSLALLARDAGRESGAAAP